MNKDGITSHRRNNAHNKISLNFGKACYDKAIGVVSGFDGTETNYKMICFAGPNFEFVRVNSEVCVICIEPSSGEGYFGLFAIDNSV